MIAWFAHSTPVPRWAVTVLFAAAVAVLVAMGFTADVARQVVEQRDSEAGQVDRLEEMCRSAADGSGVCAPGAFKVVPR